ncbi:hypothetical protein LTR15_011083 [Elasticomyces elasticus]|nr:hypothetical protein LTR15_011083 [Elasticomyces elasticus]
MKFSLAATTILSAISMAAATINIGTVEYIDGATDNVAWVGGKSPCTFSVINGASSNPCGPHFETSNKESYYLGYCGTGSFALYNADGSYNHVSLLSIY